ncbi:PK beta-barrel-protein domain-containing protein-like protein [Massarina eburnea CBS 473.64]|uniref:PK beta-barrel-protein domain-containing protein-like protein n=1 Tax=Massarina eburnea CBS 473.64 TaxID=1395130 RepID=A0A6A6S3F1_9PLEO|nr:PK beta-barrel-protein domain-containing protein-like protein [Massarina eburnea CBS 473.64]
MGAPIDLSAPFDHDTILEVRSGRMKRMPGLEIESGIDKTLHDRPVWVGKLGIDGDEHDLTFHGGVDKAVHGYCSSHYPSWASEFPLAASRFTPGGFGENLVTSHMNERNVCIGDIISITSPTSTQPPLLLQISLPRQPCFKLNHRFQLKNFAPNTWKYSRTGWYYRVLCEGWVAAGDEVRLVERKWPEWTIERVQEFLHRRKDDEEMNKALAEIEDLGDEARNAFKKRVVQAEAKKKKGTEVKWTEYRVVEKKRQTERIVSLIFDAVEKTEEKPDQGSHVKIRLGNGLVRAYSVVDGSQGRFQLGIALDDNSRGGSRYLHEKINVGDVIQASPFTAGIVPNGMASNHVFIVGGIGITAFLWLAEAMVQINWSVQIHFAVRSGDEVPFKERLEKLGKSVVVYDKEKGERMSIAQIIKAMPWNSSVYCCGPRRLMDDVKASVDAAGIPESEAHFEAFEADVGGDAFEVVVEKEGEKGSAVMKVGEEETLLEVLEKAFGDIPSSCEVGNCGTCRVRVKCGKVEHRGTALTAQEKKTEMLTCVSRGMGRIVIEI